MKSLARVKLGRFHTRRLCRYSGLPLPRNRAGTDLPLRVLLQRAQRKDGWMGWNATTSQDAVCLCVHTNPR